MTEIYWLIEVTYDDGFIATTGATALYKIQDSIMALSANYAEHGDIKKIVCQ